jgi:L-ascorbate metabolism protein UlaG (beta-lactamase superfamily)
MIKLQSLGQVGYRLDIADTIIYIDPYLSNSVQEKEDAGISRLIPIPMMPSEVKDANYVLITHNHRDHCDEDTLISLAKASPYCKFFAPVNAGNYLTNLGIDLDRIVFIKENFIQINNKIKLYPIPAAHPNIQVNIEGGWDCIGYVIEFENKRLYHAGDTAVHDELIAKLKQL